MGLPRFTSPKSGDSELCPRLYVANCGPAVGISYETVASIFGTYGEVMGVFAADETGTRVIVSYHEKECAKYARSALNGKRYEGLGGRALHIQYSVQSPNKVNSFELVPASNSASELNIPGLHLVLDFVSAKEEEVKDRLLESCLQQWIACPGNIWPKDEFNIMDLSFVMI